MNSVTFAGEDESQPSTSNGNTYYKLSTRLLDGCGAGNHALIPRKLRSAMKKRGREFVTSPLLTSRRQHPVTTTVDTLRKDCAKKSKLNMKQGHITKDEEEVAETLYALAGMFSDSNKSDQQNIDDEKPEIKSFATLEEGISINAAQDTCPILQEETRKIGSKITLGAEEVISQTLEARQPECFSSKQAATPNSSVDQSDLSPGSTSRLPISRLSMNQSDEQEIHLDRAAATGFQDGKKCRSIGDKCNDLFHSPNMSATRATNSEAHRSCQSARSRWFEGTSFSSQPHVIENKISSKKCTRVATESNKSWKRCSAHIYISRLIKVLQISDRKEGSPVKPTQPTTCRGAELKSHVSTHNQMLSRNGDTYFSAIDVVGAKNDLSEIQNGILMHKRPVRDQQMASETTALCSSAKQEYDFLSLGTGHCGLDTGKSANGAGCFLDPSKQYHMPYMQSQNQSMLFSLPQNGYSSSLHSHNSASAAQQVQLSQYHNSIVNSNLTARAGQQQMDSQPQKWAAQLQTHYNTSGGGGGGGGGVPRLPDWKNGGIDSASVLNYAHSLFPHLHAALGSKYQQLSPSQQQLMLMNTSLPLSNIKRRHNLPLGFERN